MPLAPAPEKPKYKYDPVEHWDVFRWEDGKMDDDIAPPSGMRWVAIPPGEVATDDTVLWFPSGEQAISYLEALRPVRPCADFVLNPIGAQHK